MTYNVSGVGSQVIGIAGMGIGLGLLAGTARGVMDTMYPQRRKRIQPRQRPKTYRQTPYYQRPYKPRGGPYDFHLKRK